MAQRQLRAGVIIILFALTTGILLGFLNTGWKEGAQLKIENTQNVSSESMSFNVEASVLPGNRSLKRDLTQIEKRLQERLSRMRLVCEKYRKEVDEAVRDDKDNYKREGRIIRDNTHRLSICLTPKAGSTFLTDFITKISRSGQYSTSRTSSAFSINSYWAAADKLSNLQLVKEGQSMMYQRDISMAIVRNPWQRLVSVFLQKLPKTNKERWKFIHKCSPYIGEAKEMTFEEFLKCAVLQMKDGYYNRHWEPVYKRCNLCHYNYTYIIKQESLDEELSYILRRYSIQDLENKIKLSRNATLRQVESQHLSSSYTQYYRHLTDFTLIAQFAEYHAIDMHMFQYPISPFSKNKYT